MKGRHEWGWFCLMIVEMKCHHLRFIHLIISLMVLVSGSVRAQGSLDWVLRKDQDSIRVFVADDPDVAIKQIRTEFTLKAKPEELIRELLRADL